MNADEIAWQNQKMAKPVDWAGLGVIGLSPPKREFAEGAIPIFWTALLRSHVENMRFRGYDIELWVGKGWVQRKFAVKGSPGAVKAFSRWFAEISRQA